MEVEGVAKRQGIDLERVIAIYKRSPDTGFFPVLVPFQTNLDRAIAILGKNKALQLFETEDLSKLEERVFLVDEITFSPPPLYSLDELQQVLEDFIPYLLKNRVHLLETGQPLTKFDRSLWLDSQLANLYHFDFPRGFSPPPKEDRDRLKADRGKILDLKVAILRILSRAIKRKASVNLWDDCLRVLTETVSSEEAEFYLGMDQLYMGYDVRDKGAPEEIPGLDRPGGFTDLLEVIGHIEKELTLGTLAETRNALADLLTFGQWNRPLLLVSNYFEAIEHPLRDTLDSALDLFSSLELKEIDFWENYRNRVNEALENEFYGDFIYRDKVKRKFMRQFKPHAIKYLDLMKSYLQATGKLPPISVPPVEDTEIRDVFVFHKGNNDFWTIVYEGKRCPLLKDEHGLQYIAYLLNHPDREVHAMELHHLGKVNIDPAANHYGKMSDEELAKEGSRITRLTHAGERLHPKTVAQYRNSLKEYREELAEAERNNDKGRIEKIRKDMQKIEEQLTSGLGLGGRFRNEANPNERARKSVTNCIKRSLKKISKADPNLWRHLFDHIHTGTFCSYTPEQRIPWKL